MEYNPKWVVVSNDDMILNDNIAELKKELLKIDPAKTSIVLTRKTSYHTVPFAIHRYRYIYKAIFSKIDSEKRDFYKIQERFNLNYGFVADVITDHSSNLQKLKYFVFSRILTKDIGFDTLIVGASFTILSCEWLKFIREFMLDEVLFDETFINAMEDVDLSIRILIAKSKVDLIDYKIDNFVGGSLGNDYTRQLRTIAGDVYFFEKQSKFLYG